MVQNPCQSLSPGNIGRRTVDGRSQLSDAGEQTIVNQQFTVTSRRITRLGTVNFLTQKCRKSQLESVKVRYLHVLAIGTVRDSLFPGRTSVRPLGEWFPPVVPAFRVSAIR